MDDYLHGYARRLRRALRSLDQGDMSPADRKLILAFHEDCFTEGLTTPRVEKCVRHLLTLAQWLDVPFQDAGLTHIKQLLHKILNSHYADWTKCDLRLALRRFYRWLRQNGRTQLDLSWIRLGNPAKKRKLPRDMPSPQDVKAMITATSSARNKAFIMLLYETAARIGEIARLRIRDVVSHRHGLEVYLPFEGKTGARRVLVVASTPYMKAWLNQHPKGHHPHAWLWPCRPANKPIGYAAFSRILRIAAAAAGVKKKINPHNFRHSRATRLANHLTEAQMDQFFGWEQGSKMPARYVHLSGRDVDAALLRSYGIDAEQHPETDKLAPRKCNGCNTENPATHSYCGLCGLPLDEKAVQQALKINLERTRADGIMNKLIQHKEFRQFLEKKLKELGYAKR